MHELHHGIWEGLACRHEKCRGADVAFVPRSPVPRLNSTKCPSTIRPNEQIVRVHNDHLIA
jgi:hypothetical protein